MTTVRQRQKIRITLKAFDHRLLDASAVQIVEAAEGSLRQQRRIPIQNHNVPTKAL